MKKFLIKFLIMSILITTILPLNSVVFAIDSEEAKVKETIEDKYNEKDESGNYKYISYVLDESTNCYKISVNMEGLADTDKLVKFDGVGAECIQIGNSKYVPKITAVSTKEEQPYFALFSSFESGSKAVFAVGTVNGDNYTTGENGEYLQEGSIRLSLEYAGEVENEDLDTLEALLARLVTALANGVNLILSAIIGRNLTIDDLVFDNYEMTELSYFNGSGSSTLIWGIGADGSAGNGEGGLHATINEWYGIFNQIAVIAYMIILVYMGIRIMLASTGEKRSQYQTLFVHWVVGVAILFFYPYVMKYAIKLNVAFVKIVESAREVSIQSAPVNVQTGLDTAGLAALDFDQSPFGESSGASDYMSAIGKKAQESHRLALAVAYMIMTWQLITLTVHYYKRLLMVGFLIVIFPLVAASYAIDKVADGKSQSFNKWNKEFILNVFIQSFHAIVYVFVCNTVYAAGMTDDNYDYILIIVGVTFLFTGEEIIKKIFSQDSPGGSVKSLAATAAITLTAANLAKNAVTKATNTVMGVDSAVTRTRNAAANLKSANYKAENFDKLAKPQSAPNAGLRLDGAQDAMSAIDADTSLSDAEKQAKKSQTLDLANAVADINNPNSRSAEELSNAYDKVLGAMQANPNDPMLRNLRLSADQLRGMEDVRHDMAAMVASGITDTVTIEREVKLRMGYVLDGMDDDSQTRLNTMLLTNVALHGVSRGFTREGTETEINEMVSELSSMQGSIIGQYKTNYDEKLREDEENDSARTLLSRVGIDMKNADDDTKSLAHSLAILKDRKSGKYSISEQFEALNNVKEHRDDSDEVATMVSNMEDEDVDFDVLRHLMAKQVVEDSSKSGISDEIIEAAKGVVDEYESDSRAGFYDDEVSVHDMIKHMGNDEEMEQLKSDLQLARRKTNQKERELTQDIAADILANNGVTITEGGLDTETKYLDGQTREEILLEQKSAKRRIIKNLLGINATDIDDGLTAGERRKAFNEMNNEEDPTNRTSFWEELGKDGGPSVQDMINQRQANRTKNYYDHYRGDQ